MSYTKKDFETDNEVRWCPGCGDYAVLASMQRFLPTLGLPPEDIVFISGIGCSSRFPYYMNTYGFHTIHGRAPTIATGLKLARPELSVWVVTGDGDGLSIGANHLLHLLRRNVNINVLLFNNQIYGLTKGQFSPTSERGKVTKSSPEGALEAPVLPMKFALGAGASFIARAIDVDAQGMNTVLKAAAAHQGCSFIEIYQNCNVFNDGAFASFADRRVRADKTISVCPNQPMVYGADSEKGLSFDGHRWECVEANKADTWPQNPSEAQLIALANVSDPVPVGVFCGYSRPTYESGVQVDCPSMEKLSALLHSGDTWTVEDR